MEEVEGCWVALAAIACSRAYLSDSSCLALDVGGASGPLTLALEFNEADELEECIDGWMEATRG